MSDDARAEILAAALGEVVEGETVDDGVSALLTLLWRICDHAGLEPREVADTFVAGAYRAQVALGTASDVGEA